MGKNALFNLEGFKDSKVLRIAFIASEMNSRSFS